MADKNILLVEGADDEEVFDQLRKYAGWSENDFKIISGAGIEMLRKKKLEVRFKASDLRRLGIVVDADNNIDRRWQKVCNALVYFGYSLPPTPNSKGTIVAHATEPDDYPQVGVWMMPDNQQPGALEAFIDLLIPSTDLLWPHAQNVVDDLPARPFIDNHLNKAKIHTWLAWQKRPGISMGKAIKENNALNQAAPVQDLVAWLRTLFELP